MAFRCIPDIQESAAVAVLKAVLGENTKGSISMHSQELVGGLPTPRTSEESTETLPTVDDFLDVFMKYPRSATLCRAALRSHLRVDELTELLWALQRVLTSVISAASSARAGLSIEARFSQVRGRPHFEVPELTQITSGNLFPAGGARLVVLGTLFP